MKSLFLVVLLLTQQEEPKQPIPGLDVQGNARALIQTVYRADIDNLKTPQQKISLADNLFKVAEDTKTDDAYVLFQMAKDYAIEAQHPELAFKAIEGLSKRYDVNQLRLKAESLNSIAQQNKDYQRLKPYFDQVINEAIKENNYEVAKGIADVGLLTARKSNSADTKMATEVITIVTEAKNAYDDTKTAREILKQSPSDPEANRIVGKYHCEVKNEWDVGIPMLALSNQEPERSLAIKELKGELPLEIADGWWKVKELHTGQAKANIKAHAKQWYEKSLPELSGLNKVKVEQRLEDSDDGVIYDLLAENQKVLKGTWKMEKGILVGGNANSKGAIIDFGEFKAKEYECIIDMQVISRPKDGGDMVFKMPYTEYLRFKPDGNRTIIGFDTQNKTTTIPGRFVLGKGHRLHLKTTKGKTTLSIDGKQVFQNDHPNNNDASIRIALSNEILIKIHKLELKVK